MRVGRVRAGRVRACVCVIVGDPALCPSSFGHQDAVAALDALSRECCVTAGGRDGTVRVWKIPEESQLVFYGHQ